MLLVTALAGLPAHREHRFITTSVASKRCWEPPVKTVNLHQSVPAAALVLCVGCIGSLWPYRRRVVSRSWSIRAASHQEGSNRDVSKVVARVKKNEVPVQTEERIKQVESTISALADGDDILLDDPQAPELDPDKEEVPVATPRYRDVRKSLPAFLFFPQPGYRAFAANVPGDAGFDPLNLCTDLDTFNKYREAEVKHGRLAMIAAVGWPLAEIAEPQLSEDLRFPDVLAGTGGKLLFSEGLVGDLGDQFVETLIALIVLFGAIFELGRPENAVGPANYGFDPLGLEDWKGPPWADLKPRPWMAEAEVQHCRIAMLAITFDIVDEALTGNPVVEDSEFLFHRLDVKFFRPDYWLVMPEEWTSVPIELTGTITGMPTSPTLPETLS